MSQFVATQTQPALLTLFAEGDPNADAKHEEAANVRLIHEVFAAVLAEDLDALGDRLDDDVEFEVIGPAGTPMAGHHRGRERVLAAIRSNFGLLEQQDFVIASVVAQGEDVVLVGREQGRYRATGHPYDLHFVQVFTVRAGRIARIREFVDTAALLAASGGWQNPTPQGAG